uniref:hypothetical protein n=1 Tax=Candidatus Pantoea persica TaxID=2518128 RepID=UPI00215DC3AF|nr:hypothetical protein [Candidatus Pantoea persica]
MNPLAEVSYRHRFGDDDSRVTAGPSSTRTAFSRQSGERINAFAGVATATRVS